MFFSIADCVALLWRNCTCFWFIVRLFMKSGTTFDIDFIEQRETVNAIIANFAISKDLNQIGLTVHCLDDNKMPFNLIQLHKIPNLVCMVVD